MLRCCDMIFIVWCILRKLLVFSICISLWCWLVFSLCGVVVRCVVNVLMCCWIVFVLVGLSVLMMVLLFVW